MGRAESDEFTLAVRHESISCSLTDSVSELLLHPNMDALLSAGSGLSAGSKRSIRTSLRAAHVSAEQTPCSRRDPTTSERRA